MQSLTEVEPLAQSHTAHEWCRDSNPRVSPWWQTAVGDRLHHALCRPLPCSLWSVPGLPGPAECGGKDVVPPQASPFNGLQLLLLPSWKSGFGGP